MLRNDSNLNHYLNKTSNKISDQIAWLENYYKKNDDFYFVIERIKDKRQEGLIALYDIDFKNNTAEWGRWILRTESMAAIESALMIYKFAFEELKLEKIYSRTVSLNKKIVSFHDSCGITSKKVLKDYFELNGKKVDSIEHTVDKTTYSDVVNKLEKLSNLMAKRIC
jgi:RimJ/RimL family protein N-acetyltransferase